MNCDLETFEAGRGPDRSTYVVIERTLADEYESAGERRMAFFMRSHEIAATVKARKLRGQKTFLFYEILKEGRVWYALVGKGVN